MEPLHQRPVGALNCFCLVSLLLAVQGGCGEGVQPATVILGDEAQIHITVTNDNPDRRTFFLRYSVSGPEAERGSPLSGVLLAGNAIAPGAGRDFSLSLRERDIVVVEVSGWHPDYPDDMRWRVSETFDFVVTIPQQRCALVYSADGVEAPAITAGCAE